VSTWRSSASLAFGLVLDFQHIKPLVRVLVNELDERWILPARASRGCASSTARTAWSRCATASASTPLPRRTCSSLPINNTSAENLATLLGRELLQRLRVRYPDVAVRGLSLAVEETAGQRGVYHFTPE